jgi:transposase InsO family protein
LVLLINAMDWYLSYGHLPFPLFRHIPEALPALKFSTFPCNAHSTRKSTKPLNYRHGIQTTQPLHLIHHDLCGPISPITYNGYRYVCTIIDDFSRFTIIKTFKNKSKAAQAVLDLISLMKSQSGYQAKILQTDNGGEYRSNEFISDLNKYGTTLKETVPYYSETNPVAQRTNRTIMMFARTSIIQSGLPKTFWPEAVAHAVFTKN